MHPEANRTQVEAQYFTSRSRACIDRIFRPNLAKLSGEEIGICVNRLPLAVSVAQDDHRADLMWPTVLIRVPDNV